MSWFKLWDDAQNDPKLESLTDAQHRVFFRMLCFANKQTERGVIPDMKPRLLALQVSGGDVDLLQETVEALCEIDILDCDGTDLRFTNWPKRQARKPSDEPSATRLRKQEQRARERIQKDNVTPLSRPVTRNVTQKKRIKEEEEEEESLTPPISPPTGGNGAVEAVDNFETFYGEFKAVYPAREGKRLGIDTAAKQAARALSSKDWDSVLIAARHYADSGRLPVDPARFFKSRDYPGGMWREWVEAPERTNGTGGYKNGVQTTEQRRLTPEQASARQEQGLQQRLDALARRKLSAGETKPA